LDSSKKDRQIDDAGQDTGHFSSAYTLEVAQDTLAHYSSWAQSYDQKVGTDNAYAQPARATEMLLRYLSPANCRLLDAGCGSGLSGVALARAGFKSLDGCDFSTEMLEQAEKKSIYGNLFEADLNQPLTQIADATYDAVTAVGVFSFGHVDPKACVELLRVLKPDGFLIVALNEQFWNRGDLAAQLENLVKSGLISERAREFGEHLPGHDVKGWVLALEKIAR